MAFIRVETLMTELAESAPHECILLHANDLDLGIPQSMSKAVCDLWQQSSLTVRRSWSALISKLEPPLLASYSKKA